MKKICDLHTHSLFSDGTSTPKELIDLAVELGLSAVVLSDHNTVAGIQPFLDAAKGQPIEAIVGSEFSVDYDGTELHLLGLFIPEEALSKVTALMEEVVAWKEQSNVDLVAALNRGGYHIDYAEIKRKSPKGTINRAHIATELMEKGYVASRQEAFDTVLAKKGKYYVEPKRPTFWDVLDFIVEIGAVPVLAHPFLQLNEQQLEAFLPEAKKRGLVGMECYYPLYSAETTETALRLAEKFGLKPSGGSDFHGDKKPDIQMGSGKGNLCVPYEWAQALRGDK